MLNTILQFIPNGVAATFAIIIGLVVLVWSADRFIDGSASVAKILGVPSLIIGMVIVGFGTSAPEITVSIIAAINRNSGIVLGNAYGSNIANIALILGTTAIIFPFIAHRKTIKRDLPILILLTLLSTYMVSDGIITKAESWLLLLLFLIIMSLIVFKDTKEHRQNSEIESEYNQEKSLGLALFWLVVGLVLLILSSRLFVWGAVEIAHQLGVSDLVIGLTIVAVGTSLPELASSIIAARKGEDDIALGNVVGSNMFNLLCVIGFAGIIHPIDAPSEVLYRDIPMMMFLNLLLLVFCLKIGNNQRKVGRIKGIILLASFVAYLIWVSVNTFQAA